MLTCPICGSAATSGASTGDSTLYVCPQCGGYKLAGTVETLFANGKLQKPTPERFRQVVAKKRGASSELPVITSFDIGG